MNMQLFRYVKVVELGRNAIKSSKNSEQKYELIQWGEFFGANHPINTL